MAELIPAVLSPLRSSRGRRHALQAGSCRVKRHQQAGTASSRSMAARGAGWERTREPPKTPYKSGGRRVWKGVCSRTTAATATLEPRNAGLEPKWLRTASTRAVVCQSASTHAPVQRNYFWMIAGSAKCSSAAPCAKLASQNWTWKCQKKMPRPAILRPTSVLGSGIAAHASPSVRRCSLCKALH